MMNAAWSAWFVDIFEVVVCIGVAALLLVFVFALWSWLLDTSEGQEVQTAFTKAWEAEHLAHQTAEAVCARNEPVVPISQFSGIVIKLNAAEVQSGFDRVGWAEGLILQLSDHHDGRNSWLLNYGRGIVAAELRRRHSVAFDETTQSARLS